MSNILNIFLEITKISRCSFKTKQMAEYIIEKARNYGYKIEIDNAKNILLSSKEPKICLQAHYDMVCVGDAPKIEPEIEGNILKAKNSSLGADNGIAIAMMLKLMQEQVQAEFLFTNDEEVGLLGAKDLNLNIKSKKLLNLDSEDEALVYIGCAGGVDLKATKELELSEDNGEFYEISISNLPGGHSGVDIDKNIPNAIIELAKFIKDNNLKVVSFSGGERINSIPANAKAVVCAKEELKPNSFIEVRRLDKSFKVTNFEIETLTDMKNGVIDYSSEFDAVQNSSNLALVKVADNKATIEISLRSLSNEELENLAKVAKESYELLGYKVELNDKYPAWKPEINNFTKEVENAIKEVFNSCQRVVIHAGLECGLLSQKLPNVQIASIGPNIRFPHSTREYVELDSVERVFEVVKKLVLSQILY